MVKKYTYFDICRALFGANTNAFEIEEIHDFVLKGLKSRKPYCLYYGDYAIEINGNFDSIIASLRREFDKTYVEVNKTYEIIKDVLGQNAYYYTDLIDKIVKTGDKYNVFSMATTKMGHDYNEQFIKADLLPGFVVSKYLKRDSSAQSEIPLDSQQKPKIFFGQDETTRKSVAKITVDYLKEVMQQKCKLEPETVYDAGIKKHFKAIVSQDSLFSGKEIYLRQDVVVIESAGTLSYVMEYISNLASRLLDRIHKDYLSIADIHKKMNAMPVFANRFSVQEVRDKLLKSSAFEHCGMSELQKDMKKNIYLQATEFEAFLEDEYPELWELYLYRRNPWLSVGALTRLVNLSSDTIVEILEDMAQKDMAQKLYSDLVRYETRNGKEYHPFLNPNYTAVFSDYAKRYVKQRDAQKKKQQEPAPQNTPVKELKIPFVEEKATEKVPEKTPVKKERKVVRHSISPDYKEPFYVNGANRTVLPDIRILNPNINASNPYLNPEDFQEMFRPDYLANSRKKSVPAIVSKQETMLNIIKLFIKNTRRYHEEKVKDDAHRDIRLIQRCEKILQGEAQSLERDAEFIKTQFHIDILPLVSLYKQGQIPEMEKVFEFFYEHPSNVVSFTKQINGIIR